MTGMGSREIPEELLVGKRVLVIWHQAHSPEDMRPALEDLRRRAGAVLLEHAERLIVASHPESSFDTVLSGVLLPPSLSHSPDLLEEVARILRPSGSLLLWEPAATQGQVTGLRPLTKVSSSLKLSGFVNVSECKVLESGNELGEKFRTGLEKCGIAVKEEDLKNIRVAQVQAEKPAYEIGTSSQLSFANKLKSNAKPPVSEETAKIWSLSTNDMLDDDLDLVDPDTLLAEEDLLKPDPSSLRSTCGPESGRRKACKNCSCGLAEILESEVQGGTPKPGPVTSSCGSCYLGDAFRCASCPYLGMPAFKPGEQIKLTERQLRPDT